MNPLKATVRPGVRLLLAVALTAPCTLPGIAAAQAPAAAPATRQMGTVKAVSGTTLTLSTDAGQSIAVSVADGARIVQLAPGSTDLKTAQPIVLTDIGAGDRVLVTGKPGDPANNAPDAFSATRVILMKSGDIAQKHATEQADWQRRGVGGIVSAVSAPDTLTISSGAKKIQVQTAATTIFRRYGLDSIKFEDAKPSTFAQIQVGDQFEVRGAKSADGTSIQAEEVVSGTFRNLSGTLLSVNATAGTLTLKDLTTKKVMTVSITANSDVRKLPPEIAARFAARQRGVDATSTGTGAGTGTRPGAPPAGSPPVRSTDSPAASNASAPGAGAGSYGAGRPAGMSGAGQGRSGAGMDLSKMLARLPAATLADLHLGDAVMIVASQAQPGADTVTAVTLLAGVEPILAATPTGSQGMTLSPWSVGGGAPEGGGGTP